MCAQNFSISKKPFNTPILYLVSITLGIISGLSDVAFLHNAGLLVSDVFIKIFKCISLPIIALSIIVTLSHHKMGNNTKMIGQKALFYTVTTTLIAAGVALILYLLIAPSNIVSSHVEVPFEGATSSSQVKYWDHLIQIIPENILAPFLEHQVLGVLLMSMIIGVAIRYIPEVKARSAITEFFKGAHGIFMVMTRWIVKIIPVAIYGFITAAVIQLKGGMNASGLGGYLMVIILANLIQGLVILPIFLYANHIQPFKAMRAMSPALSVAFFSKSSAGALPVTIEAAEKRWGISPHISRLVLPLCTSINMNGCAAFIFTTVIYLMQNNGMDISLATMALWVLVATIAAVGNAGVPMGCFFLSASLLTSMNVPITLLGLILPFYSMIDMLETALNVWSDSCVTKVIDEKVKILKEDVLSKNLSSYGDDRG